MFGGDESNAPVLGRSRPPYSLGPMAPITSRIEVARPAEEVFAYVIDASTMSPWQQGCVRGTWTAPRTASAPTARLCEKSVAVSAG